MLFVIGLFWLSFYGKVYAFCYGFCIHQGGERRRERMLERVEVIGGLDGYVYIYYAILCEEISLYLQAMRLVISRHKQINLQL